MHDRRGTGYSDIEFKEEAGGGLGKLPPRGIMQRCNTLQGRTVRNKTNSHGPIPFVCVLSTGRHVGQSWTLLPGRTGSVPLQNPLQVQGRFALPQTPSAPSVMLTEPMGNDVDEPSVAIEEYDRSVVTDGSLFEVVLVRVYSLHYKG